MHVKLVSGEPRWALRDAIASDGRDHLVLKFTLALLVLYGADGGAVQIVILVLAGGMLVLPGLLMNSHLWWVLLTGVAAHNLQNWYAIDNHKYLIMYWTLACTLWIHGGRQREDLRRTAQALVALVFAFAVFWKVYAGQYVDGSFMRWTLVTDPRLEGITAYLLNTGTPDLGTTREAIRMAGVLGHTDLSVPLETSRSLVRVAFGLSWMGLVVEGIVAVAHFIPGPRAYQLRHASLMVFILLTYFLLPVRGFAFALAVLGLAQCRTDDSGRVMTYVVMFGLIQLTMLAWQSFLPGRP